MTQKSDNSLESKTIGTVITATGNEESGGMKKALKEIQGMTLAERIVVNFQRAGVKDIVIVTDEQSEQLKKQLKGFGVTFLQNQDANKKEMLDSVKLGLEYLQGRCEAVFICPVDVPFFSAETVKKLSKVQGNVVIPSYDHRGGHPVLLNQEVFGFILSYSGKDGLRGAIHSMKKRPTYVEITDQGTVEPVKRQELDMDVVNEHHKNLKRAQVKVRLVHTKPYFGPGTVTLLRQIHRLGSVREASEKTGISYSKAWNMIRIAESESGLKLVDRQPGGKFGGVAKLTDAGLELIEKYEELEKSVEQYAEKEFQRIFENAHT